MSQLRNYSIVLLIFSLAILLQAESSPLPHLKKKGNTKQLIVDGEPFLMRAGELGNSSASSKKYMKPIWNKLEKNNLIGLDKVNKEKYFVLTEEGYYLLESGKRIIKSNRRNRYLKYPPLELNDHFLVSVEFIIDFLNFDINKNGDLIYPDDSEKNNSKNNLRLRVYLNDDEFNRYEDLEVIIEIMNPNRNEINLRFNSAQKYNIYIKNRFGRVLYSWAEGKIFSQAVQNIEIEGKDSLSFEEEIDLRQFREGRYYVEVEITADNYNFETIEKEFEIDD